MAGKEIEVCNFGPVREMGAHALGDKTNLVFARNGMGKSFLARGFRYLDMYGQGKDVSDAVERLLSEEAGAGHFKLCRGGCVDEIKLEKGKPPEITLSDTIFHVFSEDYVHEALREKAYTLDGDISHQITVRGERFMCRMRKRRSTLPKQRGRTHMKCLKRDLKKKKMAIGSARLALREI